MMVEEEQSEVVSSTAQIHRWNSAETLSFEEECNTGEIDSELEDFLKQNRCSICWVCLRFFHLTCMTTNITVEDLRDYIEEDFCCTNCLQH